MSAQRIFGIVLLILGLLALVYGGFSFTKESHQIDLGPIELEANEKETVNLPAWLGIAFVVGGIVLMVLPSRR